MFQFLWKKTTHHNKKQLIKSSYWLNTLLFVKLYFKNDFSIDPSIKLCIGLLSHLKLPLHLWRLFAKQETLIFFSKLQTFSSLFKLTNTSTLLKHLGFPSNLSIIAFLTFKNKCYFFFGLSYQKQFLRILLP